MNKLIHFRPSLSQSVFVLFFLMYCLTSTRLLAQNNPVTGLTYYAKEEVKTQRPPSFPGGHKKLEAFIRKEVENSPNGVKLGRKVQMTATIDETGRVIELKPVDNADPSLGKELKRIASLMPIWKAGKVNGKGVLTDYTFLLKRNP